MLKDKINQLFNINDDIDRFIDKQSFSIKTLQFRLKDKHDSYLTNLSNQVNMIWNFCNEQLFLAGKALSLWDSYNLKDYELGSGTISQDSRGRWYINITVKVRQWTCEPNKIQQQKDSTNIRNAIGIDLGLKDFLVTSDSQKEEAQKIYRNAQQKLAIAQRANKPKRVSAIHAQIKNRRKDYLHKLSTDLVSKNSAIFVGNVNSSGLAKTNMAKSVLDAGWSSFRTMLMYKSNIAGVWFDEVSESYTTQDCHVCSARTGPKGLEGLNIRECTPSGGLATPDCPVCLTHHDRGINAAINIKNKGIKIMNNKLTVTVEEKSDEAVMNKIANHHTDAVGGFVIGVGYDPLVAGIGRP